MTNKLVKFASMLIDFDALLSEGLDHFYHDLSVILIDLIFFIFNF